MARPGLDKADVKQACAQLVAQGRYPSVDAVRATLGNTGSKTTIHKYLKELEKEAGKADDGRARTASTIRNVIDELAAQLHADADARIADYRAEHARELQRHADEIARLQKQVQALGFQLREAETLARNAQWANELYGHDLERIHPSTGGFGRFDSLINNDRAGTPGFSKFDILFNCRTSTPGDALLNRACNEVFLRS